MQNLFLPLVGRCSGSHFPSSVKCAGYSVRFQRDHFWASLPARIRFVWTQLCSFCCRRTRAACNTIIFAVSRTQPAHTPPTDPLPPAGGLSAPHLFGGARRKLAIHRIGAAAAAKRRPPHPQACKKPFRSSQHRHEKFSWFNSSLNIAVYIILSEKDALIN